MSTLYLVLTGAAVIAFFTGITIVVVNIASATFGRAGVSKSLSAIDRVYGAGGGRVNAAGRVVDTGERIAPPQMNNRMTQLGRAATSGSSLTRLRRWLDYAGNPPYWTVERVFEIKGLGLVAVGIIGTPIGFALGAGLGAVIGGLAGAVIGFFIPDLVIYQLSDNRQQKIRKTMPDILDMLTVSVEAGLGFDAALTQITRYARGPVANEFARVLQEMQIGRSRADALRGLGQRSNVSELRSFCAIVVQASELGVPIAAVMREQSKEMRIRRRQHAEELAQKVPIKILFPLIFCLFPAIFIVILGPGIINILAVFSKK
jgi:tight adherence protein C